MFQLDRENTNELEPTPDEKASSIINSVPTSSLWTKTGGVVLGTAVTAAAVSTELYVRFRSGGMDQD